MSRHDTPLFLACQLQRHTKSLARIFLAGILTVDISPREGLRRLSREKLAKWLARRREQAELTQQQLADRVGCEKANISKIETARSTPPLDTLALICKHVGAPLTEPLTEMGYLKPHPQPEPHVLRLIHYYQGLPPIEQKLAEELVKTLWRQRGSKEESERPRKKKHA